MQRYTRRLFSQAISGAIVSLPMVNSLLRGDEPPRPFVNAEICVRAEGFDKDGKFVQTAVYCDSFDTAVKSCATAYLGLDEKASKDIVDNYHAIEFWVVVVKNDGCPDIIVDPETEGSIRANAPGSGCVNPRWQVIVICTQCDGGHRPGIGVGLTKIGARIKAQRDLGKKLCLAKTKCATRRKVIVRRLNRTTACCD